MKCYGKYKSRNNVIVKFNCSRCEEYVERELNPGRKKDFDNEEFHFCSSKCQKLFPKSKCIEAMRKANIKNWADKEKREKRIENLKQTFIKNGITTRVKVKATCPICKNDFEKEVKLSHLERWNNCKEHFCSFKCKRHKNEEYESQCFTCGKTIVRRLTVKGIERLKNGGRSYCSLKCQRKYWNTNGIKKARTGAKPTKTEIEVKLFLNSVSNDYKYVGNGKFWIQGFNPDFVNVNGQKKLIELNGCYWHNCKRCFPNGDGFDKVRKDDRKYKTYHKYGWQILVIWEHEIKDNSFKNKISNFIRS